MFSYSSNRSKWLNRCLIIRILWLQRCRWENNVHFLDFCSHFLLLHGQIGVIEAEEERDQEMNPQNECDSDSHSGMSLGRDKTSKPNVYETPATTISLTPSPFPSRHQRAHSPHERMQSNGLNWTFCCDRRYKVILNTHTLVPGNLCVCINGNKCCQSTAAHSPSCCCCKFSASHIFGVTLCGEVCSIYTRYWRISKP